MKKYTLIDYFDIWSDDDGNYSVNDVMKYDDFLEVADNASDDEIITALVKSGYLRENVEYFIMASDEYFMEVWHKDMPICALI
jgi:hypothetical protein